MGFDFVKLLHGMEEAREAAEWCEKRPETPETAAQRLSEIRARLAVASPGPWHACAASAGRCACGLVWAADEEHTIAITADYVNGDQEPGRPENAQFIAHSRADVEWLLQRADAAAAPACSVVRPHPHSAKCTSCMRQLALVNMEQVHPSNGFGTCKVCFAFLWDLATAATHPAANDPKTLGERAMLLRDAWRANRRGPR